MADLRHYQVPSMSCEHCVSTIGDAVRQVGGVESVSVDLEQKDVAVSGGADADVRAAIEAAGYEVA